MTKNKHAWFIKVRGSYLPSNSMGFLIYILYVAYIILLAIGWVVDGHRIWYALTQVIALAIGAALVTQYIASKHTT